MIRVRRVSKALPDLSVRKVIPAPSDRRVPRASLALKDLQDPSDPRVTPVLKEFLAPSARRGRKVWLARRALLAPKVPRGPQVRSVLKAILALPALRDPLVLRDPLDLKVLSARPVRRALQVPKVQPARRVRPGQG